MSSFRRHLVKRSIDRNQAVTFANSAFNANNLDELTEKIAAATAGLFQCPICVLMLIEEDFLQIKSFQGIDPSLIVKTIPINKGISGRVLKRGEPRIFTELESLNSIAEGYEEYYSGSLASAPLSFNNEIIGIINICRPSPVSPLNRNDLNRLITYADQIAYAVQSQKQVDEKTLELKIAQDELKIANELLEAKVAQRTKELIKVNYELREDIVKREKVEQELRRSEAKYSALVDSTNDGIAIIQDNVLKYVNPGACRLSGYSYQEMIDKPFLEFVLPEQREEVFHRYIDGLAIHSRSLFEMNVLKKDGEILPVELNNARIEYEGRPAFLVFMRDITERREAAAKLQHRIDFEYLITTISTNFVNLPPEELDENIDLALTKIANFTNVDRSYVFLYDSGKTHMSNTHEWCAYGVEPQKDNLQNVPLAEISWWTQKILKGEIINLFRIEDLPPEAASEKEILEAQDIKSIVVVPLIAGGKSIGFMGFDAVKSYRVWSESDIALLKIVGEIIASSLERKNAAQALKSSRERLKILFEYAPEGYFVCDLEGNLLDANKAAEKIFDCPLEQLTGRELCSFNFTPLDPHKDLQMIIQKSAAGQWFDPAEFRLTQKDNLYVFVEIITYPITIDDRMVILGMAHDITRRKQAEELLIIEKELGYELNAAGNLKEGADVLINAVLKINGIDGGCVYLPVKDDNDGNKFAMVTQQGIVPIGISSEIDLKMIPCCQESYTTGRKESICVCSLELSRYNNDECSIKSAWLLPSVHNQKTTVILKLFSRTFTEIPQHIQNALESISVHIGGAAARLEAESALRESRRNLQTLFDTLSDFIFIFDETGNILKVNPIYNQQTGFTNEELAQKHILDLHPPEYRDYAEEIFADIMSNKTSICPAPFLIKDGGTIPVETKVCRGKWDGKDVFFGISRDISERKKAEEDLMQAYSLLRSLVNSIPDYIFYLDLNGVFLGCNQAFLGLMGMDEESLVQKKLTDTLFKNNPNLLAKLGITKAGGNKIKHIEEWLTPPSGKPILLDTITSPYYGPDGVVLGVICISRDITNRKLSEQKIKRAYEQLSKAKKAIAKHAKELEFANEELSQYAYVVSHDLKAPLRAIHNYADFLREDLEGQLEGDQLEYLDGMSRAVLQAKQLVDDLLELSRIGRKHIEYSRINLTEFLRDLVEILNISDDVVIKVQEGLPIIETEKTLVKQVFSNLILNGIKFNKSNPKIIEIGSIINRSGEIELFVKDNGIGIDPVYQEKIFKVFQRLHSSSEYEGTGIGLAIVRKALSMLNGTVRVESEAGKGSVFYISLPSVKREAQSEQQAI